MTGETSSVFFAYMKNFPSIKRSEDFRLVYRKGRACANEALVMYVLKKEGEGRRIGISASKKNGNSVVRHRIARVLRECFRLHLDELKPGYDMVVVARQPAAKLGYKEMCGYYMDLCSRAGILL